MGDRPGLREALHQFRSGDTILSFYASPTGRYRGFECLQQKDERRYSVRGTLLEEDKVISTWSLELTST